MNINLFQSLKALRLLRQATIKPIQPAYDGISRGGRKSRGTRTGTAILVAEDSLASQMALKRTIKKAFRLLNKPEPVIRIVGDGSEAAQALMNKKFNIVFTDIFMPNMTGTQLLQSIREKYDLLGKYMSGPCIISSSALGTNMSRPCAGSQLMSCQS